MKNLLIAFAVVLFSSSAFARQYVQCSSKDHNTTDVMVVNLQTENGGTVFLSSGMQNDESERLLMNIAFAKKENGKHFYNIVHEGASGYLTIDSKEIGKYSDYLKVEFFFGQYSFKYSCFAAIYND